MDLQPGQQQRDDEAEADRGHADATA